MKPKSLKSLKKLAWHHFRLYILKRDNYKCITCPNTKETAIMQSGHFVHHTLAIYFNEKNVNAQCKNCNMTMKVSQDGLGYDKKLDAKFGKGTADSLRARRWEKFKPTRQWYLEIINKYKEG